MSLPKPGWFGFERKRVTLAHYVTRPNETLRPALCRARLSLKVRKDRRWDVCQGGMTASPEPLGEEAEGVRVAVA